MPPVTTIHYPGAVLTVAVGLTVLPERTLRDLPLDDMSLQSVGWPVSADQVTPADPGSPGPDAPGRW